MALAPGDTLGPYECIAPIGAGGMGEVFKARDTRLDRMVALKTSTAQFSERFECEARAIAALNHPNICQLYDVGPDYLVMEFIEGMLAVTEKRVNLDRRRWRGRTGQGCDYDARLVFCACSASRSR